MSGNENTMPKVDGRGLRKLNNMRVRLRERVAFANCNDTRVKAIKRLRYIEAAILKQEQEESAMSEKLKPCPFCGGEDIFPRWIIASDLYHCMCDNVKCQARGPKRLTKEEAIEAWNRRVGNE